MNDFRTPPPSPVSENSEKPLSIEYFKIPKGDFMFIVIIQIKKKTTHRYIILEFDRFIEVLPTVGCISGINLFSHRIGL